MAANAPPTILVVEDEFASLEVLSMMLEAKGYRVFGAGDGEEALARLQEMSVDLIITDYMMPKLTGVALLAELDKQPKLRDIPVIMVSANHKDDVPKVRQVVAFFNKPLLFEVLLAKVRALLPLGE